jgi:hypothetical protein
MGFGGFFYAIKVCCSANGSCDFTDWSGYFADKGHCGSGGTTGASWGCSFGIDFNDIQRERIAFY